MVRVLLVIPLLVAALGHTHVHADQKPIVAVFDIEDRTARVAAEDLAQLSHFLTSKVAEGGMFSVIPGAQIKRRLVQEKINSYKDCYDQQCQIEIGRELAANKSLATQIIQFGDRCIVVSTLYDLKRVATVAAASERSSCALESLVAAVEKITSALKEQVRPPTRSADGVIAVRSDPTNASVFLDGSPAGKTPTELKVKPGDHSIRLEKVGRVPGMREEVAVKPGKVVVVSMTLAPIKVVEQDPAAPVKPSRKMVSPLSRRSDRARTASGHKGHTPFYKRWWFWPAIGAVVVGAGVGVGVGVAGAQGDGRVPQGPALEYSTFK